MDDEGHIFAGRLRAAVPRGGGAPMPVAELERLAKRRSRRRRAGAAVTAALSVALGSGGVYVAVGANAGSDQAAAPSQAKTGPPSAQPLGPGPYSGIHLTCPQQTRGLSRTTGAPPLKDAHIGAVAVCHYRYSGGIFQLDSHFLREDPAVVRKVANGTLASPRARHFSPPCPPTVPRIPAPVSRADVLVVADRLGHRYPYFYSPSCANFAYARYPAEDMLPTPELVRTLEAIKGR